MGVHGLWKLIEPIGKPIPLESLENKVLAVDVSIWLYQLTKGLQTTGGAAVQNAHILGLFNRICKLLYYRIKPIFVFDGGVPALKRETIEVRKRQKLKAKNSSEELREKLLKNLLQQKAVNELIGSDAIASTSRQTESDLFELPPLPEETAENIEESNEESDTEMATAKVQSFCDYQYGKDVHSIDITSSQFKSLPPEIRHEILSELIETRKQSSWGHIHEMPEESTDFSQYQMKRLMKRRNVQRSLDEAAKEMGGRMMTLGELEDMFREDGIVTDSLPGRRIAKDNITRFIYVTGEKSERKNSEKKLSAPDVDREPIAGPAKPVTKHEEIEEVEFRNMSYKIDEQIFIKDSSSDEEEIIQKDGVDDYAKLLSLEEKLSQEEIFNIIKLRQNNSTDKAVKPNSQNPSLSTDIDLTSLEEKNSKKADPTMITNSEGVDNSQAGTSSAKKFSLELEELQSSPDLIEDSQEQSVISEKSKASFAVENAENFSKSMSRLDQMINAITCASAVVDESETRSVELFNESDSDNDFIEVTNVSTSCPYFSNTNKPESMEITIDLTHANEDDIFSDVFQTKDAVEGTHNVEGKVIENEVHGDEKGDSQENHVSVKKLADIFDKVKKISSETGTSTKKNEVSPVAKQLQVQEPLHENPELLNVQKVLLEEEMELQSKHAKQERLGSTITQQMILEAQELIRLFGLPYLIAPMEAEAQCAFLDQASLTEGTITDDSDIWLFGGKNVYKNFFDNRKYVLQFRNLDIEHFFKLSREQLIQMALLVGSDYTVGIESVGPITAIEILAYFSDKSNKPETKADIAETLSKFKRWIAENRNNTSALSRKAKNLKLSEEFPSVHVIEAYLSPTVDESKERFTWATPDLDQIRSYMKTKFGWKPSRIDDVLMPVMKRLNNRNKQTTLDAYFKAKPFMPIDKGNISERVIRAINIMKNKVDIDVSALPTKSPRKKRSTATKSPKTKPSPKKSQRQPKTGVSKSLLKVFSPQKLGTSSTQEAIPQRERDRLEAAKKKMEAVKILRRNQKNKTKRKIVLPPKADSSYLSESSSEDD